ncbi:hypothetical protein HPB49_015230 [Dermacentor silvarum]|uniref:Uncharacterized protein n=1 Tax=Dermacentor silvarum TaxID=543639 RepID=A0ACB8CLE7_DERSI|nr:hypothetical protein HPB49_015230 [Dermacentor silvarum]
MYAALAHGDVLFPVCNDFVCYEEYLEDHADGSWLTARGRRGRSAGARPESAASRQDTQHLKQILPRRPQGPPALPIDDFKVILRPRNSLTLGEWPRHSLTHAIGIEVGLKGQEVDERYIRVQAAPNIAIISNPSERIATSLTKMASLTIGLHRNPISTYIVTSPDNAC